MSKLTTTQKKTLVKKLEELGVSLLPDSKTHRHRMEIRSESSDRLYVVSQRISNGSMQWECGCMGWIRHRHCKHLDSMAPMLNVMGSLSSSIAPQLEYKPKLGAKAPAITKSVHPDEKDAKRIEDIVKKADGDNKKILGLCERMAKSIKDEDKAKRRAEAAKVILPKAIASKAYRIFYNG